MTYQELRTKYPKFVYESFSHHTTSGKLTCEFKYSIPPDHAFTHTVAFENLQLDARRHTLDALVFNLGLAEMTNYWKTTCSPTIEIQAGHLSDEQIHFWKKLFINGFGQYFYENHIDFTSPDFLKIISTPDNFMATSDNFVTISDKILVPLGGGKDSIATLELLKKDFKVTPIIVEPTTPASYKIAGLAKVNPPVIARRIFDPKLFELNKLGYLNGHVPYSAILAFIFLPIADAQNIPYISVSNERSSEEGSVEYLGQTINHQYSKTLEFESDFNKYINPLTTHNSQPITYFSFLRPLYDLQITKLFSKYPQYFPVFRSCNVGQKTDSWCGKCPKCLSVAMALLPWTSKKTIVDIFGSNPLSSTLNVDLLSSMVNPQKTKPFECITTIEEAQVCLEFISAGNTPRVQKFLSSWGPAYMPSRFNKILKAAYAGS